MKLKELNYKAWFLNYVKKYGQKPEIILKRDHSLRVEKNMKETFKNWDVNEEYLALADFIGLFHDIGRFEQWNKYSTFSDDNSIDHANLGVDILFHPIIAKKLLGDRTFDFIILDSIYNHNKFILPNNLTIKDEDIFKELKSFENSNDLDKCASINSLYSMAIRDADKLDILKLYILSDYLSVNSDLPVSSKIANDFISNKLVSKWDIKSPNDTILLRLAFINDINLTCFLKQIKEENLIEKINEIYPNKELVQPYFDHTKKRLDELIEINKNTQYVLKK